MIASSLFWACATVVAWTYLGYPAWAAWSARRRGRAPWLGKACPPLTVVICARDEAARIGGRVADVLAQDYPADALQVVVVSDGSVDRTAEIAEGAGARVVRLAHNVGKAAALNLALEHVDTDLIAFTDARQRFGAGTLRALVAPFADSRVGSVSGTLVIAPLAGSAHAAPVGAYWRMETRLRSDEARLGWLHAVSGAVHAVRRDLFVPLPAGTLLDDMWIPLKVAMAGRWVWMARAAVAYDVASTGGGEEFARKLRTLAGNWQLVARLPALLSPRANPVFFAWWSHKFMRLLVPWAMLLALPAAALAPGRFYATAFAVQVFGYAAATLGLLLPRLAARVPLLPAGGTFVMLNLAALLALPASLALDPSRLWKRH